MHTVTVNSLVNVSGLATSDKLSVLWNNWIQLPVQHDIYVSLLSDVGGRIVPRSDGGLLFYVPVWRNANDYILF